MNENKNLAPSVYDNNEGVSKSFSGPNALKDAHKAYEDLGNTNAVLTGTKGQIIRNKKFVPETGRSKYSNYTTQELKDATERYENEHPYDDEDLDREHTDILTELNRRNRAERDEAMKLFGIEPKDAGFKNKYLTNMERSELKKGDIVNVMFGNGHETGREREMIGNDNDDNKWEVIGEESANMDGSYGGTEQGGDYEDHFLRIRNTKYPEMTRLIKGWEVEKDGFRNRRGN